MRHVVARGHELLLQALVLVSVPRPTAGVGLRLEGSGDGLEGDDVDAVVCGACRGDDLDQEIAIINQARTCCTVNGVTTCSVAPP